MEKKKLKLTISGSSKKTKDSIELAKSQGKKTVVIEKKSRFSSKPSFLKNDTQRKFQNKTSINFEPKKTSFTKPNQSNDFEKTMEVLKILVPEYSTHTRFVQQTTQISLSQDTFLN